MKNKKNQRVLKKVDVRVKLNSKMCGLDIQLGRSSGYSKASISRSTKMTTLPLLENQVKVNQP